MNKAKKKKTLIIFAGANGSGKTTLAEPFLQYAKVKEFINADSIAYGLSPFNPGGQRIAAGKLVLSRTHELLEKGDGFAIETTLSGRTLVALLKDARKKNYHIRLFYLYTTDIRVNLRRIKYRVKQGGHNVPSIDVRRRYKRSLHNLFHVYYDLCDIITVYDNTKGEPECIAVKIERNTTLVLKTKRDLWQQMKKQAEDNG